MIVEKIELKNYRNYKELDLELDPNINVIYGKNAQGKTNIIEAIYFCAYGRSHKGTNDKDIINFDENEAHIKLISKKDGISHRTDIHLKKEGRKGIAVDGTVLKKIMDLFGEVKAVMFAPEDLSIVKNAPADRRRFIDAELCQTDRLYAYELLNYNKALMQKNKLLKQLEKDPKLAGTLDIWNEQLIRYGRPVIEKRRQFIKELNSIIYDIHLSLSENKEKIEIKYLPKCTESSIDDDINSGKIREIGAKMALYGPHRDDIKIEINNINVRDFGSQGQQRTAALSLKMAEIELVKRKTGDTPVLLLDDVLSELDKTRQERLLKSLSGIQTIITCTGIEDIITSNININKKFKVEEGTITDRS